MSNKKIFISWCAFLLCAILLVSCASGGVSQTTTAAETTKAPASGTTAATPPADTTVSPADTAAPATDTTVIPAETAEAAPSGNTLSESYDAAIKLADNGSTVSGGGTTISGNTVTITAGGTYLVTGTLTDGQILVAAPDDEKVKLILNGVDVSCSTGSAIYASSGDKLTVNVEKGSVNKLSDGANYPATAAESNNPDAVIYSACDLDLSGKGTLYVTGSYLRGIHTNDDLSVKNLTLSVTAPDDGLRGNKSVEIESGDITVTAGADGIRTNNETDTGKGYITISGGNITVTAECDAIQAVTDLTVSGGNITVKSGGGAANSSATSDSWGSWGGGKSSFGNRQMPGGMQFPDGATGEIPQMPGQTNTTTTDESTSAKGLKAAGILTISGGTITVDSSDDSIHSNSTVTVSGGTLSLTSGDDGIHADTELNISGGTILVTKSYEGIESAKILISGGDIDITASDDGVNAAGGNDASSLGGRAGQNMFSESSGSIEITGGTILVNASGDGIDSNGNITQSGGDIVVFGPTDSGNGALDYGGTYVVSGGTLYAFGSTGMAQGTSSGSTQASIFATVSGSADSKFVLYDNDGNVIFETTVPKKYGCIVASAPQIKEGSTYKLSVGGSESTATATAYTTGGMGGGFGGMGKRQ